MTAQRPDYRTLRDTIAIVNAVEADLRRRPKRSDHHSLPRLALILSRTIQPLPDDATAALDAAGAYLDYGQTVLADAWIHSWASRISVPPAEASVAAARDRLVWIALNRNSDFSDYGVEFTLQAAEDAGVRREDMVSAVAEVMEGLGRGE